MKNTNFLKMPSILDKEISDVKNDKFGHIHYAKALFSIIENHTPPFSIGLLGEWGTGKSSIKELCIKEFLNTKEGKKKYFWIDFNAWRYESEDVRKSLLRHLYRKISNDKKEKLLKQKLYSITTDHVKRPKKWSEIWSEITDNASVLIQITILVIFFILCAWFCNLIFHFQEGGLKIIYSCSIICATAISKFLFEHSGLKISSYVPRTITNNPIITSEQFEEAILEILKKKHNKSVNKKKIIVFIDDLDRLSTDKMIKGLDAIRVFLDIKESDLIFVVSCYDEHIAKSIAETKSTFSNMESARKYLDRVFQFKIDVPRLPNQSMKDFTKEHLKALDVYDSLNDDISKSKSYDLDKILNCLIPIEISSPRAAIQILNSFLQAWWIAKQREEQCDSCQKEQRKECPTQSECLLIKDVISNHLDILAIVTLLKNQFPNFYIDLTLEPQLLKYILKLIFSIKADDVIANSQLDLITDKYLDLEILNKNNKCVLKDKNLLSYLASIQTTTIPEDLKPFISLLQDNLEMEIGSHSTPIYNALITQNKYKLNDILGINDKTTQLSDNQTAQLKRVADEIISREDNYRTELAYITLTSLANLYSGIHAKSLINNIAEIIIYKMFIKKINIADIESLLNNELLNEQNINAIYYYLLSTIKSNKVITQKDSKENCEKVFDIGLKLAFEKQQLKEQNRNHFIKLLNEGIYQHKSKDNESPYESKINVEFYISKIKQYGEKLLKILDLNYVVDLLDYINNLDNNDDVNDFVAHIDFIINNTEIRENPSIQLARVLNFGFANTNSDVIHYFNSLVKEKNAFDKISKKEIPNIIDSYTQRILNHFSVNKPLDNIEQHIDNLISLINNYTSIVHNEIDTIIEPNLKNLVYRLADEYPSLFDRLFTIYRNLFITNSEEILNSLVKKIFLTENIEENELISHELLIILSKKYIGKLQIEQLANVLSSLFEDYQENVDDENADRYFTLISNLDNKIYTDENFIKHISNMYNSIEVALDDGYDDYFDSMFDIISPLFDKIKTEQLDSLLSCIVEKHFKEETDKTEKLYNLLKDSWPHEDKNILPSYSLVDIMHAAEKNIENAFNSKSDINTTIIYNSILAIYTNLLNKKDIGYKKILVVCLYKIWKLDIEFAHTNMLTFIDIVRDNFLYEVLCTRNSTKNPKLLDDIWQRCIQGDKENNLIEKTKKFISNKFYVDNIFKINWLKIIKNRNNGIIIITKSIESIDTDDEFNNFITSKDNLVKIFKKEFLDDDINCIAKSLLNLYKNQSNGTRKRSIAIYIRELIGINGSHILNASSLKSCSKKDIVALSKVFTGNVAITRLVNKMSKSKRTAAR